MEYLAIFDIALYWQVSFVTIHSLTGRVIGVQLNYIFKKVRRKILSTKIFRRKFQSQSVDIDPYASRARYIIQSTCCQFLKYTFTKHFPYGQAVINTVLLAVDRDFR